MNDKQHSLMVESLAKKAAWNDASRKEEKAHADFKNAHHEFSASMAEDLGFAVGDIIEKQQYFLLNREWVDVPRKERLKILYFDVDIVGDDSVPGYPHYSVTAVGRYVNKTGEIIERRDRAMVRLNYGGHKWAKV